MSKKTKIFNKQQDIKDEKRRLLVFQKYNYEEAKGNMILNQNKNNVSPIKSLNEDKNLITFNHNKEVELLIKNYAILSGKKFCYERGGLYNDNSLLTKRIHRIHIHNELIPKQPMISNCHFKKKVLLYREVIKTPNLNVCYYKKENILTECKLRHPIRNKQYFCVKIHKEKIKRSLEVVNNIKFKLSKKRRRVIFKTNENNSKSNNKNNSKENKNSYINYKTKSSNIKNSKKQKLTQYNTRLNNIKSNNSPKKRIIKVTTNTTSHNFGLKKNKSQKQPKLRNIPEQNDDNLVSSLQNILFKNYNNTKLNKFMTYYDYNNNPEKKTSDNTSIKMSDNNKDNFTNMYYTKNRMINNDIINKILREKMLYSKKYDEEIYCDNNYISILNMKKSFISTNSKSNLGRKNHIFKNRSALNLKDYEINLNDTESQGIKDGNNDNIIMNNDKLHSLSKRERRLSNLMKNNNIELPNLKLTNTSNKFSFRTSKGIIKKIASKSQDNIFINKNKYINLKNMNKDSNQFLQKKIDIDSCAHINEDSLFYNKKRIYDKHYGNQSNCPKCQSMDMKISLMKEKLCDSKISFKNELITRKFGLTKKRNNTSSPFIYQRIKKFNTGNIRITENKRQRNYICRKFPLIEQIKHSSEILNDQIPKCQIIRNYFRVKS